MRIKIAKRPDGEAPEWVRDAWIGLTLEALNSQPRSSRAVGVLSGPRGWWAWAWTALTKRTFEYEGYAVVAREAVDALSVINPNAALWWRQNCAHMLDGHHAFMFRTSECTVDEP